MFDIVALVNAVAAALAVAAISTPCAAVFPMSLLLLSSKLPLVMVDCCFFFSLLVRFLFIPCCHRLPSFAVVGHALTLFAIICHHLPLFAISIPTAHVCYCRCNLPCCPSKLASFPACALHFHWLIVNMFVISIVD